MTDSERTTSPEEGRVGWPLGEVGMVRVDDLRRLLMDALRKPCPCELCVDARRRLRALAWPKHDAKEWPVVEEMPHAE